MRTYRYLPLALLTFLVAGCGASAEPSEPPVTVFVTQTAEPVEEQTSTPDPVKSAPVETEAHADLAAAPEPEPEVTFTMPDLVGQNLQLAQDILQDIGSFVLDQEDASGLDRFQVNDSNWTVCTQDPAPGTVIEVSVIVTLASVKLGEVCP